MVNVDYFKQQAKNLLKDYNTKTFDENEGFYVYNPRFFNDIDDIVINFDINEEEPFSLMNAQHIIARLSGFYKWNELIKASDARLELGKLLLTNREDYQEKLGLFTNMSESLIVDEWKDYEEKFLKDFDDDAKLEVFKQVFLDEGTSKNTKNPKIRFNLSKDEHGQDMIKKIMDKKGLSAEKALLSTITQKNCVTILSTGWAGMALSLWGHDNPEREMEKLDDPIVEFKLSKEKERLVSIVMEKEEVSLKEAIFYFVIFTMEALGYHI